ncbi:50S ribosomal protein L18 [Candidatus Uhrbacteria bacterium CG_4_9_14_3_um_filter_36_7]|uniref:Large ribosomal subunit protein uL18 n=1 Tax=Candidatus Uhrbacteria bacterium CG_4_9_14_3_um_filter_36_7 TaxID=1975033 RepID=A0A2M7XHE0_9BACT|nr:MAG: 50S ribosomal protein L18 [Candidatus Uhrbacteria bacterium CG_4_9_14_3_um_filter_36_7]
MKDIKEKQRKRFLRIKRVRSRIHGTSDCPRLAVKRSLRFIYAQLIDDEAGRTLVSASDRFFPNTSEKKTKSDRAKQVGQEISRLAKEKGIERVVFDRRGYRYHGRVAALADGAREQGLIF